MNDFPFLALNNTVKFGLTTASTYSTINLQGCNALQVFNTSTAVNGIATLLVTSAAVTSPTTADSAPGAHIPPNSTRLISIAGNGSTASYITAALSSGTGNLWITPGIGR